MAEVIHLHSMVTDYDTLAKHVREDGELVGPRGRMTRELRNVMFVLDDPTESLPFGTGRDLNTRIAAIEAVQLIGQFSDPRLNVGASSNFKRFMEDDGTFWAPYGVRTAGQVRDVVDKLTADRDSRQAVVSLWHPHKDNIADKRDYPCTLTLTFGIRQDKLELTVHMRSSDVWLGIPYDVFQFTQLQQTIARALDVDMGRYVHHSVSLHAYCEHWGLIEALHEGTSTYIPHGFGIFHDGTSGQRWDSASDRARKIGQGFTLSTITTSETWYLERVIGSFRAYDEAHHG